jgi:hypothetical protein
VHQLLMFGPLAMWTSWWVFKDKNQDDRKLKEPFQLVEEGQESWCLVSQKAWLQGAPSKPSSYAA